MYKVFIDNVPVFLSKSMEIQSLNDNCVFVDYEGLSQLQTLLLPLDAQSYRAGLCIHTPDVEALWTDFQSIYKHVSAAGGLVKNPAGEVLFIYRLDTWDLPKGKLEKGESPQEGAVREVEEETGLTNITCHDLSHISWHTYRRKGKDCLKKTYWYAMEVSGEQNLVPQTEEDITAVAWIKQEDFQKVYANTYGSIIDVLEA